MKTMMEEKRWAPSLLLTLVAFAVAASSVAATGIAPTRVTKEASGLAASARPHVDVVFVIDSTGSMSGEITTAKKRMLKIADGIAAAREKPILRFGVVTFRDRGDAYVVKKHDLSADLEGVRGFVQGIHAGGGGDTPEDVRSALKMAVNDMSWSPRRDALKLIFLIGDAHPKKYEDLPSCSETASVAAKLGIAINAIACSSGGQKELIRIWKRVAELSDGSFQLLHRHGSWGTGGLETMIVDIVRQRAVARDMTYEAGDEPLANKADIAKKADSVQNAKSTAANAGPSIESPLVLRDGATGRELTLVDLKLRIAAHGPLSLTEMELVFRNEVERIVDGRFTARLPKGATVTRFAKEIDGQLVDGVFVERKRAEAVYRRQLHKMSNPALLKKEEGNEFSMRVFPIEPRSTTRLLVSFSAVTPRDHDGRRRLVLPLKGLPTIEQFSLSLNCRPLEGARLTVVKSWFGLDRTREGMGTVYRCEDRQRQFRPPYDLVLQLDHHRRRTTARSRRRRRLATAEAHRDHSCIATRLDGGTYQLISLCPQATGTDQRDALDTDEYWFVVDTSASAARHAAHRLAVVEAMLARLADLAPRAQLRLSAFDLDHVDMGQPFRRSRGLAEAMDALRKRPSLGASNFAGLLETIGSHFRQLAASERTCTVVVVSDCVATYGARDEPTLLEKLGEVPTTARLHVLAVGTAVDRTLATTLTKRGHGRLVTFPLTSQFLTAARERVDELRRPLGRTFSVGLTGAEWLWPQTFTDVRPGREVVTFAKLRRGPEPTLRVSWHDDKAASPKLVSSEPTVVTTAGSVVETRVISCPTMAPLLEREAWRNNVARLAFEERQTTDQQKRKKLQEQQLELSLAHRVLTKRTAILVLASQEEYAHHGIKQSATPAVLVVGKDGVSLRRPLTIAPEKKVTGADNSEGATKKAAGSKNDAVASKDDKSKGDTSKRGADRKGKGVGKKAASTKASTGRKVSSPAPSRLVPGKRAFPVGRDPVIKVHAPADTRHIVALFPWGETKRFTRHGPSDTWSCRFIVPKRLDHGTYDVIVIITRRDHRKERLVFTFKADRKAPVGHGSGTAIRKTGDQWLVNLLVTAAKDTIRVVAVARDGSTRDLKHDVRTRRWSTAFAIEGCNEDTVTIPVILYDKANNRMTVEIEVELR